jgi:hypothetical protein
MLLIGDLVVALPKVLSGNEPQSSFGRDRPELITSFNSKKQTLVSILPTEVLMYMGSQRRPPDKKAGPYGYKRGVIIFHCVMRQCGSIVWICSEDSTIERKATHDNAHVT